MSVNHSEPDNPEQIQAVKGLHQMALRLQSYLTLAATYVNELATNGVELAKADTEIANLEATLQTAKAARDALQVVRSRTVTELRGLRTIIHSMEDSEREAVRSNEDRALS